MLRHSELAPPTIMNAAREQGSQSGYFATVRKILLDLLSEHLSRAIERSWWIFQLVLDGSNYLQKQRKFSASSMRAKRN